jgi:hypothetical protein
MTTNTCPNCGHHAAAEAETCLRCGHAFSPANGIPDGKLPPDLLAWARQTFDEAEFLAGVREVRDTGGVRFEEFIGEIERRLSARD